MNPRRGQSLLSFVAPCMIVFWLAARPAGVPVQQSGIRLEINGARAPINHIVKSAGQGQPPLVSVLALTWFGWRTEWDKNSRTLTAIQEGKTVRIMAGAGQASVQREGDAQPRTVRFQPAAQISQDRGQQLLLPANVFQEVFNIRCQWDAPAKTLYLGELPTPSPEEVRAWCDVLGIEDTSVFHRSTLRIVTLQFQAGITEVEREKIKDLVIIIRTNKAASLQVYEKVGDEEAKLLFNKDVEYYPRDPRKQTSYRISARRREGVALENTRSGKILYVAIATSPILKADDNLLDVLKRSSVSGDWAIQGITLTVKP